MDIDFTKLSVAEATKIIQASGVDPEEAQRRAEFLTGNFEDDVMDEPSLKESFLQNLTLKAGGAKKGHTFFGNQWTKISGGVKGAVSGAKKKWSSMPESKKNAIKSLLGGAATLAVSLIAAGVGEMLSGPNRYRSNLNSQYNKWGGKKRGTLGDYLNTEEGNNTALDLGRQFLRSRNRQSTKESGKATMGILTQFKEKFNKKRANKHNKGSGYKESHMVVKEESGRYRWLTVASSGYQDKDGQWVTKAGLQNFAERFMANQKETTVGVIPLRPNDKPVVYRAWHIGEPNPVTKEAGPGLDLGYADFAAFEDGHLILSGLFFDETVGAAFARTQKEWGDSIGFFHPPTEPNAQKEFRQIDVFEVSALPMGRASNPFTSTLIVQETK